MRAASPFSSSPASSRTTGPNLVGPALGLRHRPKVLIAPEAAQGFGVSLFSWTASTYPGKPPHPATGHAQLPGHDPQVPLRASHCSPGDTRPLRLLLHLLSEDIPVTRRSCRKSTASLTLERAALSTGGPRRSPTVWVVVPTTTSREVGMPSPSSPRTMQPSIRRRSERSPSSDVRLPDREDAGWPTGVVRIFGEEGGPGGRGCRRRRFR